jgi:hypothetical protein
MHARYIVGEGLLVLKAVMVTIIMIMMVMTTDICSS